MVWTGKGVGVAEIRAAELHSAMRASVDQHIDAAVSMADHHHRLVADMGAPEVARIRYLSLESDVTPSGTAEDTFLLQFVDRRILVDPVGNPRQALARPLSSRAVGMSNIQSVAHSSQG